MRITCRIECRIIVILAVTGMYEVLQECAEPVCIASPFTVYTESMRIWLDLPDDLVAQLADEARICLGRRSKRWSSMRTGCSGLPAINSVSSWRSRRATNSTAS